jgi:hypothetical protein
VTWLGDAILHRLDPNYLMYIGLVRGLRTEDGTALDVQANISDVLSDNAHVWVLLKDDMLPEEGKGRTGQSFASSRVSTQRGTVRSNSRNK